MIIQRPSQHLPRIRRAWAGTRGRVAGSVRRCSEAANGVTDTVGPFRVHRMRSVGETPAEAAVGAAYAVHQGLGGIPAASVVLTSFPDADVALQSALGLNLWSYAGISGSTFGEKEPSVTQAGIALDDPELTVVPFCSHGGAVPGFGAHLKGILRAEEPLFCVMGRQGGRDDSESVELYSGLSQRLQNLFPTAHVIGALATEGEPQGVAAARSAEQERQDAIATAFGLDVPQRAARGEGFFHEALFAPPDALGGDSSPEQGAASPIATVPSDVAALGFAVYRTEGAGPSVDAATAAELFRLLFADHRVAGLISPAARRPLYEPGRDPAEWRTYPRPDLAAFASTPGEGGGATPRDDTPPAVHDPMARIRARLGGDAPPLPPVAAAAAGAAGAGAGAEGGDDVGAAREVEGEGPDPPPSDRHRERRRAATISAGERAAFDASALPASLCLPGDTEVGCSAPGAPSFPLTAHLRREAGEDVNAVEGEVLLVPVAAMALPRVTLRMTMQLRSAWVALRQALEAGTPLGLCDPERGAGTAAAVHRLHKREDIGGPRVTVLAGRRFVVLGKESVPGSFGLYRARVRYFDDDPIPRHDAPAPRSPLARRRGDADVFALAEGLEWELGRLDEAMQAAAPLIGGEAAASANFRAMLGPVPGWREPHALSCWAAQYAAGLCGAESGSGPELLTRWFHLRCTATRLQEVVDCVREHCSTLEAHASAVGDAGAAGAVLVASGDEPSEDSGE